MTTTSTKQVEQGVLACCMNEEHGKVADYYLDMGVTSNWFYDPVLQIIWEIISTLRTESKAVDPVAVTILGLKSSGFDQAAMNDCCNAVETHTYYEAYGTRLRDFYKLRVLQRACRVVLEGVELQQDPDELLAGFKSEVGKFDDSDRGMVNASEFIPEAYRQLREGGEDALGIPTGFTELDKIIDGMKREEVIYICARVGMGKSAIALNIGDRAAVDLGKHVAVFSMEMTKLAIGRRLISARAGIGQSRIRGKQIDLEVDQKVNRATNLLSQSNLWIYDRKAQSVDQIGAKCRGLKNRHGLDLVIIDYVSLIRPAKASGNRREDVDAISRDIKELAGSLEVPILVLAQLNREYEKQNRRPRLSDIREAGGIEQDADVIITIFQEPNAKQPERYELIVMKQREGPTGSTPITFKKFWTKFQDCEDEQPTE